MKNFKSLMLATIAALACIALPSCSDDDDGPGGSKSDFIGTWQKESSNYYVQLNGDGTGQSFEGSPENPRWPERFAWRVKSGRLDIDYDMGEWTDIEHFKYRFSDGGNTLDIKYFAYTEDDEYVEKDEEDTEWEVYHKVGSNNGGGNTPSQYATKIPGTWMQARIDFLSPSGTVTENFNAYSYKFISIAYNERSGNFTFNWLSNPSLSVISSKTYKLNGDKIMEGNTLMGTIEKCNPSSSDWGAMTIIWEVDAEPFNLGADCRTRGYYTLKTW